MSPIDFVSFQEAGFFTESYSMLFRYLTCLYYALINLGISETAPTTKIEALFQTITMIVSSLIFYKIHSTIVSLYSQLNYKFIKLRQEILKMSNVLIAINMPYFKQSSIKQHFRKTEASKLKQDELDCLLTDLPQQIQTTVVSCMFKPMLFANSTVQLHLIANFKD